MADDKYRAEPDMVPTEYARTKRPEMYPSVPVESSDGDQACCANTLREAADEVREVSFEGAGILVERARDLEKTRVADRAVPVESGDTTKRPEDFTLDELTMTDEERAQVVHRSEYGEQMAQAMLAWFHDGSTTEWSGEIDAYRSLANHLIAAVRDAEMERLRAEVSFWRASRWRLHTAWLSAQRRGTRLRTERAQMLADFQANDESTLADNQALADENERLRTELTGMSTMAVQARDFNASQLKQLRRAIAAAIGRDPDAAWPGNTVALTELADLRSARSDRTTLHAELVELRSRAFEVRKYWLDWPSSRRLAVRDLSQFLADAIENLADGVSTGPPS